VSQACQRHIRRTLGRAFMSSVSSVKQLFPPPKCLHQSWTRVGSIRGSGWVKMLVGRVGSSFSKCIKFSIFFLAAVQPVRNCHLLQYGLRLKNEQSELCTAPVQSSDCSGCCCCGAVSVLATEHWTVPHSVDDGSQDPLHFCKRSAVRARFLFSRPQCYKDALAAVIEENRGDELVRSG